MGLTVAIAPHALLEVGAFVTRFARPLAEWHAPPHRTSRSQRHVTGELARMPGYRSHAGIPPTLYVNSIGRAAGLRTVWGRESP